MLLVLLSLEGEPVLATPGGEADADMDMVGRILDDYEARRPDVHEALVELLPKIVPGLQDAIDRLDGEADEDS